jgi:hypothetical protein
MMALEARSGEKGVAFRREFTDGETTQRTASVVK